MNLKIITSLEEMEVVKANWKKFEQENDLFFSQRYAPIYHFAKKIDGIIAILYFYDKSSIIAIFPFYISKKGELQLICPMDYTKFFIKQHYLSVCKQVLNYIQNNNKIKSFKLGYLLGNDPLMGFLKYKLQKKLTIRFKQLPYINSKMNGSHPLKIEHIYDYKISPNDLTRLTQSMSREFATDFLLDMTARNEIIASALKVDNIIESISFIIKQTQNEYMVYCDIYNPKIKKINIIHYDYIYKLLQVKNIHISMGTPIYDYKMNNFDSRIESIFLLKYRKRHKILNYIWRLFCGN